VRLDHLLSRELVTDEPARSASWPAGVPKRRPDLEASRFGEGLALLSFERPAGESPRLRPRRTLKTAQLAKQRKRRSASLACGAALKITVVNTTASAVVVINDHRQDSKGTRWMPWHQESRKGVDGCDKPR
jgi:hypothetical protein